LTQPKSEGTAIMNKITEENATKPKGLKKRYLGREKTRV
jgi:hypothetical protein